MTETEPSKAPPTAPGALGKKPNLPMSRPAIAALSCGALGLIVTPFALGGIVVGIIALRRLARQKDELQGQGLAIAGIASGAIGIILGVFYAFMFWSVFVAIDHARATASAVRMSAIRTNAVTYAERNQGYPEHVALLASDPSFALPVAKMVAEKFNSGQRNWVTVGDYDFADYDGSFKADEAVRAAVEALDESDLVYRFGDVNFVRLEKPTEEAGLIYCWRTDETTGAFAVVMDDGSIERGLTIEAWAALRQSDAETRDRLGLPAVDLSAEP